MSANSISNIYVCLLNSISNKYASAISVINTNVSANTISNKYASAISVINTNVSANTISNKYASAISVINTNVSANSISNVSVSLRKSQRAMLTCLIILSTITTYFIIMPLTLKKLKGHIPLSVRSVVCLCAHSKECKIIVLNYHKMILHKKTDEYFFSKLSPLTDLKDQSENFVIKIS